ncbi:MAG: hypothetical protein ACJ706_04110 [Nitrososphaeraceae archaeon]
MRIIYDISHSLSFSRSIAFNDIIFSYTSSPLACRNICERIYSKKIVFGKSNYSVGKKYCRRCEVYLYHKDMFCPCCGMQLRITPSNKEGKERLRQERRIVKTI